MPDGAADLPKSPTSEAGFAPGTGALIRGSVLAPPVTVESVRTTFCGYAESEPQIFWRHTAAGYGKALQSSAERELAPVPPRYAPPPIPMGRDGDWYGRALEWVEIHSDMLAAAHGREAIFAQRERLIRQVKRQERIDAAIAAEPDADAMRQTEIALEVG